MTEKNKAEQATEPMAQDYDVLLLDFDLTLTKTHSGGALNFLRADHRVYRNDYSFSGENVALALNVACDEPARLFRFLSRQVLERQKCVAIVTMCDEMFEQGRGALLTTDTLVANYEPIGGRKMVLRWLLAIAEMALATTGGENRGTSAAQACAALFESGRFEIFAKFDADTKRWHIDEALRYFFGKNAAQTEKKENLQKEKEEKEKEDKTPKQNSRKRPRTMLTMSNVRVLYCDDSLPLLMDAKNYFEQMSHLPLETKHCPQGITSDILTWLGAET